MLYQSYNDIIYTINYNFKNNKERVDSCCIMGNQFGSRSRIIQVNVCFTLNRCGSEPDFSLFIDVNMNLTYMAFMKHLQSLIKDSISFNDKIENQRCIHYKTCNDRIEYFDFPKNKSAKEITFYYLMRNLHKSSINNNSLTIWFDVNYFETNLIKAIHKNNINEICNLLGFCNQSQKMIIDDRSFNPYKECENINHKSKLIQKTIYKLKSLNHYGKYKFDVNIFDIKQLLLLNNRFITYNIIHHFNDFINWEIILFCMENKLDIALNEFLDNDFDSTFSSFCNSSSKQR